VHVKPPVPKVTILLAVFNGEKYLNEQLTSLENQTGVAVSVIANDDGSTDSSIEILETWRKKGLIAEIYRTKNIGAANAFNFLLSTVKTGEFVAFCDQDDLWEHNKLEQMCGLIEQASYSSMVFCKRNYINDKGQPIGKPRDIRKIPSFENALVENLAPGNTVLLNHKAMELIQKYFYRNSGHFDSWVYLVVSAFGECIFLDSPLIKYRIHNNNTVGLRKKNFKVFCRALDFWERQALLFHESAHDSLSLDQQIQLAKFLGLYSMKRNFASLIYLSKYQFHRQSKKDAIVIKGLFFLRLLVGDQSWRRLLR
jgi:glycosyltransferase involved in cell wall biosynthesis